MSIAESAARVITTLLKKPELAWTVVLLIHDTKLVGPWDQKENNGNHFRMGLSLMTMSGGTVRVASIGMPRNGVYHWTINTKRTMKEGKGGIKGQSPDIENAKGRIDALLEAEGYRLVGSTV